MDQFLAREDVKVALNVTDRSWQDCDPTVYQNLQHDQILGEENNVTYLLENNVNVLVYSGDKDYVCNWRGGEKWTNNLKWTH